MKLRTKIGLAVLILMVLGGSAAFVHIVVYGFSAKDQPTKIEKFMARQFRRWAVPRAAREMKNPVPATPEVVKSGMAHFADHCASCHANDGGGGTEMGRNMYPKAPDMRKSPTQSLSDGELFYTIKNGIRLTGMPAWGDDTPESDVQSWHLVHFIRHLPNLSQEETEEMENLNPKSFEEFKENEEILKFLGEGKKAPETRKHQH
ncbi:MAG TPA: cytochrome c [Bdellovibrionota bacterium]|nr:cytochrome c [Bdellovibrionota bacterium]